MNKLIDAFLLATVSGSLLCAQGTAQPDLKAVKIDFIPGEKTVYFDDFSDMAEDEPPPHWRLRDGKVELRKGEGIRQMTTVCPGKPSLNSESFTFPKNFTTEIEAVFARENPSMDFYAWPKGVEGGQAPVWHIRIGPGEVAAYGPKDDKIGGKDLRPQLVNQVIKVALWVQDGRARVYVNGERIGDVNQMSVPADMKPPDHWTLRERCDRPTDEWMALRSIRVAESAPDPSVVFSSTGKLVTHGIMFDTDSDRLKAESAPVIKAIVRALDKNPNLKLEIDGYTDSTGNAPHNEDLSKRRAEAVKSVLVSQFQVDAGRLTSNGFGAGKPIATNDTADGRAQNRRVEFVKQ
jgi:OmpA-OmpF porin, OOP family